MSSGTGETSVTSASTEKGDTGTVAAGGSPGWTQVEGAGAVPSARDDHAAVYDPGTQRVIMFGGLGGTMDRNTVFNDTWAYDLASNTWTNLSPVGETPGPRWNHSMAVDSDHGVVYLFGGSPSFNDTWVYAPPENTWTELHPAGEVPSVRAGQAMVYVPGVKKIVLFGGNDIDNRVLDDTWIYDPAENRWARMRFFGAVPAPRARHAMVSVPETSRIVMFGGYLENGLASDTWEFDLSRSQWKELAPSGVVPSPRSAHSMVYNSARLDILAFGGYVGRDGYTNDLWAFDPAANQWSELTFDGPLPSARASQAMAYDPSTQKILMFGGLRDDAAAFLNDVWILSP